MSSEKKMIKKHFFLSTLVTTALLYPYSYSSAEETAEEEVLEESQDEPSEERVSRGQKILRRITVVESRDKVSLVPGSAALIEGEDLERSKTGTDDIHRILRQVPGINIQEEEGYGLRPNIGFRGAPNDRSAKITLMEDGILIAPAPYSAPAAYFFPAAGRMEGIEVLKGAGQIKYGPYTTGGSLNLLTTSIPEEASANGTVGIGNDNLKKIYLNAGNSWKYGGVLLETYQLETDGFKDLDSGGNTGVDLEDYNLKVRLNTDPEKTYYQELEYKFGHYDQFSDETYLGLTDEDFGNRSNRRYAASQRDTIDVDHVQHHLRHYAELSEALVFTTTLYHNLTQRNWYKLQSSGGESLGAILDAPSDFVDELDWIRGGNSPDDALAIRANQREYDSRGIQSVLGFDFEVANTKHELELGARFHTDEEDRFQAEDKFRMDAGTMVLTSAGAPGSQANRIASADAWAFYLQDKVSIDKLTVTPGVRYERIEYEQEDFGKTDPERAGLELKESKNDVDALIPGLGVHYQFTEEFSGFAGIHKGFSPPGASTDNEVEKEESVAYEVGVNYLRNSLNTQLVGFYSDYENLLGADTLSSGGSGTGDLFNAGEVTVYGLEASIAYDLVEEQDLGFSLPAKLVYTYTDAQFDNTFESSFFGSVQKGDELPYVAEHEVYASLGGVYQEFSIFLNTNFGKSMATESGEVGNKARTDSYMVFNALAEWAFSDQLKFFASVENILDREYVVARRPAGARPGLPLTAVGGVKFSF